MTENVQNQQILEKLDKISEDISGLKQEISSIKRQPEIMDAKFENLEIKIGHQKVKTDKLESNQFWVISAILLIVIQQVAKLLFAG